jgi:hypothetical protein
MKCFIFTKEKTNFLEMQGVRFEVDKVKPGGKVVPIEETSSFLVDFYADRTPIAPRVDASTVKTDSTGSFMNMALHAFSNHFPLSIRPDDIWVLLLYAFSRHVNQNAESLRSRFVSFSKGKKELRVEFDNVGESREQIWREQVFPVFSQKIKDEIGAELHGLIATGFSTSTKDDIAMFEIMLMSSMKEYFSYYCATFCGIPWIELQGTLDDWINLKSRAMKLFQELMPDYATSLEPVLDQFISAYNGKHDPEFWKCMVKKVTFGKGSGSYDVISGWINILYPFVKKGRNDHAHRSWRELQQDQGPMPEDFPVVVASVPVTFNENGTEHPIHFHAGSFGFNQDKETLILSSKSGFLVTYDPSDDVEKVKEALASVKKDTEYYYRLQNWLWDKK